MKDEYIMKMMKNAFNTNLEIYRKRKGLSQRDLAKLLNVSHRTIAYYENETTSVPVDKLESIAEILSVKPGDLVNSSNNSGKVKYQEIDTRLLKKVIELKNLPDRDQRAISNYINALIEKNNLKRRGKTDS